MKYSRLRPFLICVGAAFLSTTNLYAQNNLIEVSKNLNYKQSATPEVLDNYLFNTFYGANKNIYNLKGFEIANPGGKVIDVKVNPAGYSYAVLYRTGKKNNIKIFDGYQSNKVLYDFDSSISPYAITYSPDSRYLYVSDANSYIKKYDSKTFYLLDQWKLPFAPTSLLMSGNGYFIAATYGDNLLIINPEEKSIRDEKTFPSFIKDVDFSSDSSMLALLLDNGNIEIFNTTDFQPLYTYINRPGATAIGFHPDSKYLATAKNGDEIELLNILNNEETASLTEPDGRISYVKFLKDGKENIYLTFNSLNSIKYKLIKGLMPNYSKLLREEVVARMQEWSKILPGETEEQYLARMNDDSRLTQARLFEEEIATRMADDLISRSEVRLGAYNPVKNTLSIEFDNMPPIYLSVPKKDMTDFMDPGVLQFRNPIYGLNKDDKFELVYAEIYNTNTGKSYEFNNRDRRSYDYLSAADSFVPIELVRQSGMEEIRLTGIRNRIVDQAIKDKLISNHTNIDVSTNVVNDYDANGNKISNYTVGFKYTVEPGYSAREDFPAGKYQIQQSPAANSMLKIVSQAFERDFAQYMKPGRKVKIKITGAADALPITGRIAYDGSFGEFFNEPYYSGNELSNITLSKSGGIKNNDQLAFARAMAVKNYIAKNLTVLNNMDVDYQYCVELSNKKGGEYRRINLEFTFIDAFK